MKTQKKSKFQQRLDEVAKKYRETHPGSTEGQQLKQYTEAGWIDITKERPPYYSPVDILDEDQVAHEDWHRLSDGEREYYGNLNDNRIISGTAITHWRKRSGVTYIKYEPMTMDDIRKHRG